MTAACLAVDTGQPDPKAATDFYRGLFGWEFKDVMPRGSEGRYFIARLRGGDLAAVGSIPAAVRPVAVWNTYVWVESADDTASKVRDGGGRGRDGAVRRHGRRAHGVCTDPEGAAFCVWQAKDHRGAQIVNEPGSLTFNGMATRDVDAAESF